MTFSGKTSLIVLFVILLVNLAFHLPMIIKLPGFILDDYYLFYVIGGNASHFVSQNPGELYFLFLRPVSYFSSWLDLIVFNFSPLQMKIEGLILHLTLAAMFYLSAAGFLRYLRLEISYYAIGLVTLIFSLHAVSVWWTVWISQRNELLMLIFYVCASCMVLLYLQKNKTYFLWLFLLGYALAVLSKQQSLQLPLIILFIAAVYRKRLTNGQFRNLVRFSSAGIIIMIIAFTANIYLYSGFGLSEFASNIWKKPLSAAGALMLILIPYEADKVYSYFLVHKSAAVVLLLILMILGGGIVYFLKERSRDPIISATVLVISFFPVLFGEVSLRILGVQLFIVYTIIAVFVTQISKKAIVFIFLFIMLGLNINASLKHFQTEIFLNQFRQDYISKLDTFFTSEGIETAEQTRYTLVLTAPYSVMLPYQYYYFKNTKFGKAPMVISPAGYSYYFKSFTRVERKLEHDTLVKVELEGNTVSVKSNREYISSYISTNIAEFEEFEIAKKLTGELRGYKEIRFNIPERLSVYEKIYYNGTDWISAGEPGRTKRDMRPGITINSTRIGSD